MKKENSFIILVRFMFPLFVYITGTWTLSDWVAKNIGDFYTTGAFFGLITFIVCVLLYPYKAIANSLTKGSE